MNEDREVQQALANLDRAAQLIPAQVATVAVNFVKDRFRRQDWTDDTTKPWKPRKTHTWRGRTPRNRGRGILTDTGRLRRSIRKISANMNQIVIGTDVPYAEVHNEGFRGTVKQEIKAHSRRNNSGRSSNVKAHTRTIRQNIPRRQFIGQSATLNRIIEREVTAALMKALRNQS